LKQGNRDAAEQAFTWRTNSYSAGGQLSMRIPATRAALQIRHILFNKIPLLIRLSGPSAGPATGSGRGQETDFPGPAAWWNRRVSVLGDVNRLAPDSLTGARARSRAPWAVLLVHGSANVPEIARQDLPWCEDSGRKRLIRCARGSDRISACWKF
jgi:hypothetical protein